MRGLIALLLAPCTALAEGGAQEYACEVMGCMGEECLAQGSVFDLSILPVQVRGDGTGDFVVALDGSEHPAYQIAPEGPLVWTEGDGTVAFLYTPFDRTVFTLHRYEARQESRDVATSHFVSCWVD